LAYQLTVLSEVVGGIWLTAAFGDPEPLPGPSSLSFSSR
jgi:hypothetical protein